MWTLCPPCPRVSGPAGLGHHRVSSSPEQVGGDLCGVEVKQISTYGDCSLAVSSDGQLYGWGNSEYLQLAAVTETTQVRRRSGERGAGETGDTALIVHLFQINSPRHLPLTSCGKVVQAACGGTQVAVLNGQFTPGHTWTHRLCGYVM